MSVHEPLTPTQDLAIRESQKPVQYLFHAVEFPILRQSGMGITALAGKKLSPEMVVPIRWGDMGGMGNVNSTYYFRYFDVARHY